ncbi:MAG: inorganic diphosphatase [Pseudomonadota bacterium]
MILDMLSPGENIPYEINVVIEIPSHSPPVKYEMDKKSGAMFVDRFSNVAMFYPCNYGFVPHSLSEDGDPVDVLVATPLPVMSGSVINCRPIGLLKMSDEAGPDAKVLAVPAKGLYAPYDTIQNVDDLPLELRHQITHFFEQYKVLEPDKWVKVEGWTGTQDAQREILRSITRYERRHKADRSTEYGLKKIA